MSYWDKARPTYLENWPPELCNLSVAQVDVPLTPEEARALGQNITEYGETFVELTADQPLPADVSGIRRRVSDAVGIFPAGAFVRLGSRSPKDSWRWAREGPKVRVGEDPLRFLLDCSERVSDDLHLALANGYAPHVFVRQWVEMPPWSEFRCFMRGRRLVGVSQYHRGFAPEVAANADLVLWALPQFFRQFRAASHLDDVVFDVFVKVRKKGNETEVEVKLLEINPFFEMTDPCRFSWTGGGDFDRTFRFTGEDGKTVRVPLHP